MLEERRKAEIITYEMLEYFFNSQATDIKMAVEFIPSGTAIALSGKIPKEPDNLEQLETLLNIERNYDLEDYYDGLVGANYELEDYALIGMLTDQAKVSYENQNLEIQLFRNN